MINDISTLSKTGLKPYPAMKDSGVPWLREVPEHWSIRRLKFLLRERDARSVDGTEQLLRVSQYTGVTERKRNDGLDEPDTRAESLIGYKCVNHAELVINIMLAWNGSMGVSRYSGIVSPAYCVYRFGPFAYPWYFHYLLRSPTYKTHIKTVSTGVVESRLRLYTDDLYRLEALLPPLSEQTAIVRFLAHYDRKIRRYIRAKQKLIKLLEEQKQAIIHQAVTRGLDPNVRLKPSGVEWLGDVPEHWEVRRLKTLVSRVTSGSRGWSDFAADDGPLFIRIGNLMRASIGLDFSDAVRLKLPKEVLSEAERTRVRADDLLLSITAYIGSIAIVPEAIGEAYVSQHVACCRPITGAANTKWLAYVLLSPIGQTHGNLCMYGGTKQGLSLDDVKNYIVVVPPDVEQDTLVSLIENVTRNLDYTIYKIKQEISLLQEYRTRLIADVVTGKVDVREAGAYLPDETENEEAFEEPEELGENDGAEEQQETESLKNLRDDRDTSDQSD
jgi:type I restriction enzyme S subunit